MDDEMTLAQHEHRSQERYESLHNLLSTTKETRMEHDKINVNLSEGMGGNAALLAAMAGGGGFGGNNAVWPLVLLAALGGNRGGLFGGNGDQGVSGLNNIQGAIDTSAILSNLSDLKAAVPLAACETQQSVMSSAADTQASVLAQTNNLQNTIGHSTAAIQSTLSNLGLSQVSGFANTGDKIDALSAAQAVGFGVINSNIERTGWQLAQTVTNDGEKTRELIRSIDKTNDSRLITSQANEIVELRAAQARADDRHAIEINMTNNQNQTALQFQAQQQILGQLSNGLAMALQNIQATNQAINIGGFQQANPTNTNTNVRA